MAIDNETFEHFRELRRKKDEATKGWENLIAVWTEYKNENNKSGQVQRTLPFVDWLMYYYEAPKHLPND